MPQTAFHYEASGICGRLLAQTARRSRRPMPRTLLLPALAALIRRARGEGLTWSDWDKRQVCSPLDYSAPADEAALVAAVRGSSHRDSPVLAL